MFQLYNDGEEYWTIVRRFNKHRDIALMRRTAVKDMNALLQRTKNQAVRSRILAFLARNQGYSPSKPDGNGGPPRYA